MSLLPRASTFITRSRNPSHVLEYLTRTVPEHLHASTTQEAHSATQGPRPTVLLALGISPDDTDLAREHGAVLNDVVKELQGWSARADVVGCITAPPSVLGSKRRRSREGEPSLLSCALAVFPPSTARAFRVEYEEDGRVRVGRWHAFGAAQKEDLGETIEGVSPDGLANKHLITFSASLTLPRAITRSRSLVNLHTSATPFLTGLPHTLFFNKRILERGCVGVALDASPSMCVRPSFPGMRRVDGKVYTVSEAQGNLVTGLSGEKPTHHFLRAARAAGAEPATSLVEDQGFAMGVVVGDMVTQMHSIVSSDPSRGTLALEEGAYIPPGKQVAFFVRDLSACASDAIRHLTGQSSRPTIAFANPPYTNPFGAQFAGHGDGSAGCKDVIGDNYTVNRAASSATLPDFDQDVTLADTFLASSEEGFSMTEGGRCRIGSAVGSMVIGSGDGK
ncbi:hypothetical protein HDZ31DRAFT_42627 [Schizophyllum fasciatum]